MTEMLESVGAELFATFGGGRYVHVVGEYGQWALLRRDFDALFSREFADSEELTERLWELDSRERCFDALRICPGPYRSIEFYTPKEHA